jgi:hypothetical protein
MMHSYSISVPYAQSRAVTSFVPALLCLDLAFVKGFFLAILITSRLSVSHQEAPTYPAPEMLMQLHSQLHLLKLFSASILIKQNIYHLILGELCCQIFSHLSNVKNFTLVFQSWPS